jgi:DNA polymerase-4
VAPNKFLAKLASVEAKPIAKPDRIEPGAGVVVIAAGRERDFLDPLPVQRLWGVGPVTLEKLNRIGVQRVVDLALIDTAVLSSCLGQAQAAHLVALSVGDDDRPVEVDREAKSISHEETYSVDKCTPEEMRTELVRLADAVASRMRAADSGARTLTLKVRFAGFHTISRSTTTREFVDQPETIVDLLGPIMESIDPTPGVRLIGVAGSNLGTVHHQLTFDEVADEAPEWGARSAAIDEIRERFGSAAIGPASAVRGDGLRVVRKGAQQWGPDAG